jgi:IS1 family transposase
MGSRGLKKGDFVVWISPVTKTDSFELDEVHWFTNGRKGTENGVNTYIMTMISRNPRQILAFDVDNACDQRLIQMMVNSAPPADKYFTDGFYGYMSIDFPGKYNRNPFNKNDTCTIESTNADIRHYIAGLRRKSRCFFRKLSTLKAVLYIFVNAYNKFGHAKAKYRERHPDCRRDFSFSHVDYIC